MKKLVLIIIIASSSLMAQDLKQTARDHFNSQKWEAAIRDYEKYLKNDMNDSSVWYNLAFSQMQLAMYEEAISNFNEARARNFPPSFVYYNVGKIYALQKKEDEMLSTLKEGAENGMAAYARLTTDTVFALYRASESFKDVIEQVKLNAYPCLSAKNYRHFDFWLGEWEVYARGGKAGENSITMAQGGCAIHENYTTTGNYAGQSINYYDPIDKKWHQHWVGSSGDVYNYLETAREEGMLQFESDFMGPTGQISKSRLTFTLNEDGTVRQLFESSTDEGKTWTPAFDGLYKKKKKEDKN